MFSKFALLCWNVTGELNTWKCSPKALKTVNKMYYYNAIINSCTWYSTTNTSRSLNVVLMCFNVALMMFYCWATVCDVNVEEIEEKYTLWLNMKIVTATFGASVWHIPSWQYKSVRFDYVCIICVNILIISINPLSAERASWDIYDNFKF